MEQYHPGERYSHLEVASPPIPLPDHQATFVDPPSEPPPISKDPLTGGNGDQQQRWPRRVIVAVAVIIMVVVIAVVVGGVVGGLKAQGKCCGGGGNHTPITSPSTSSRPSKTTKPAVMSGSATALANYAYPTPISYGHRDLFVSCVAQDRSMKSKWRPSTSSGNEAWSPADGSFTAMGGVISLSEPYISVASRGQGLLDVYVAGSDSALYHKWYSSEWGPNSVMGYDRLGGGLSSSPTVVSWSKDREDIFVIGMPRGSGLYQMFWTPSGYSSWIAFGGTWATFAPTVVSWASGRLDVFLVGATDNALYHKYFDGTSWQPAIGFGSLGGYCTSRPVGVSWGTGRIDLFVRGGDSGLWHLSYDLKSGWTNWTSISGSVAIEAEPDAVSWGQKRIDVFAWGLADRAILHKSFDGENWTPEEGFESLGGDFSGPPKAASDAVGSVSVFAYGRRLNLLQKSWNQTTKQWNPKDTFLDLGTP